jgi:hypothetical protein
MLPDSLLELSIDFIHAAFAEAVSITSIALNPAATDDAVLD